MEKYQEISVPVVVSEEDLAQMLHVYDDLVLGDGSRQTLHDVSETMTMQDLLLDSHFNTQDKRHPTQKQCTVDYVFHDIISPVHSHPLQFLTPSYSSTNDDYFSSLQSLVTNTSSGLPTPCTASEGEINVAWAVVDKQEDITIDNLEYGVQTLQNCDAETADLADDRFYLSACPAEVSTGSSWPEDSISQNQIASHALSQDLSSVYPQNQLAAADLAFPAGRYRDDLDLNSDVVHAACVIDEPFGESFSNVNYSPFQTFGPTTTSALTGSNDSNANEVYLPSWPSTDQSILADGYDGLLQLPEDVHVLETPISVPQHDLEPSMDTVPGPGRDCILRDTTKDQFLLECKAQGMSYKEIKARGEFQEAESTLRGRYRTLTKPKDERVRKPEWTDQDIYILKQTVTQHLRSPGPLFSDQTCQSYHGSTKARQHALRRVPWKQVADAMYNRGCYRYGNATVKKKYLEVMGAARR